MKSKKQKKTEQAALKVYQEKVATNVGVENADKIAKKFQNLIDIPEGYKPKILWISESSVLGTGFSNYTNEVLKRLYATNKYEIHEMGSYTFAQDPRLKNIPWKHYSVLPDVITDPKTGKQVQNKQQVEQYRSRGTNQFGEWKYEEVLAKVKPDIVIDNRDHWMVEFEERYKERENFIWVILVPVDGHPQKWEWIATYERADIIMGYSHYARKVLESQSGGRIKVVEVPSPGVDLEVFKPMDKKELKNRFYGNPDLKVIGTVMRNQGRKLYPALIQAYRMFMDKYPKSFKGTILHLHTSVPDVGWDIRESLRRTGMLRHVTLTYMCGACKHVFASFFMGDQSNNYTGVCQKCGKQAARTPNTQQFLSREGLAEIYNLFDVYVQFSVSEGFGMPIVEAKACGVPIMCTDNTAMSEQARNGGGFPIPVVDDGPFSTFTESLGNANATGMREWDLPSRKAVIKMWDKFFRLSQAERDALGKQARKCTEEIYDCDDCAKIWEKVLDGTKIKDRSKYWDKPMIVYNPENILTLNDHLLSLTDQQFVLELYDKLLLENITDPSHQGVADWTKSLSSGMTRQKVLEFFAGVAQKQNNKERLRCGISESDNPAAPKRITLV